jgi:hypothetical protein
MRHCLFASVSLAALFAIGSAEAAPKLVPHRAVYDLSLAQAKGDQSVGEARGRIVFEFNGNACDGYTLSFRQVLQITDADTGDKTFDSRNVTWEDGVGATFRFDAERRMNGSVTDYGRGRAEREGNAISVSLDRPSRKNSDLDGDVLFPTQQLIRILEAAGQGQTIFESRVFDGSDGSDKVYQTTAVIGKPISDSGEKLDDDLARNGFSALKRWPVTISYFDSGAGERTPLSVISYDLLENGVTNRMRIDLGEFVLAGEPSQIEMLGEKACDK